MKVASVQFCHYDGDKEKNFALIKRFVNEAVVKDVEMIIFPEMCLTGYLFTKDLNREEMTKLAENIPNGGYCQRLQKLANENNITIGMGLVELADGGELYNNYIIARPNQKLITYRKLHCFVNQYMSSGNEYVVFSLPNGHKAGILICYDNNIIENVRLTALKGAEVIIAPHQTGGCLTQSPYCMGVIDQKLWLNREKNPEAIEAEFKGQKGRGWLLKWLPARAHDNGVYYIFSNGVGPDGNEIRTGNAMIIDPHGNIISETWQAKNMMVTAELDFSQCKKSIGAAWLNTRRPDLYKGLTCSHNEEDIKDVRFKNSF